MLESPNANIKKVTCYEGYSGAQYGANENALQGSIQILNLMGGLCHVPGQSCTMLECQRYSGIGGGVFACNNVSMPEQFISGIWKGQ